MRAGLALHHREPIDAHWSGAFVKAVLGYPIVPRAIMNPQAPILITVTVGNRVDLGVGLDYNLGYCIRKTSVHRQA